MGGQTARAVGERLRGLGGERQVLCITHLPQIAAMADRHFRIEKSATGELATASVDQLAEPAVVEELCRMLGGTPATTAPAATPRSCWPRREGTSPQFPSSAARRRSGAAPIFEG